MRSEIVLTLLTADLEMLRPSNSKILARFPVAVDYWATPASSGTANAISPSRALSIAGIAAVAIVGEPEKGRHVY